MGVAEGLEATAATVAALVVAVEKAVEYSPEAELTAEVEEAAARGGAAETVAVGVVPEREGGAAAPRGARRSRALEERVPMGTEAGASRAADAMVLAKGRAAPTPKATRAEAAVPTPKRSGG